jgi:hypothetical protein
MFLQTGQRKSGNNAVWSGGLSALLILIYLVGAFQSNSIHEFVHHESIELHSEQNEQDECHQVIYHHGKETCGHKIHISASDKCSLCHLVFHSEQLLPDDRYSIGKDPVCQPGTDHYSFSNSFYAGLLSARAPPVC